jgi:hypothetical protein
MLATIAKGRAAMVNVSLTNRGETAAKLRSFVGGAIRTGSAHRFAARLATRGRQSEKALVATFGKLGLCEYTGCEGNGMDPIRSRCCDEIPGESRSDRPVGFESTFGPKAQSIALDSSG